jgi:hypothetical protein
MERAHVRSSTLRFATRWRLPARTSSSSLQALAETALAIDDDSEDGGRPAEHDPTVPPTAEDHWHAAYGVYACDQFVDVAEFFESTAGIHSHGDDLIHIHPFSGEGAGENATLGTFVEGSPLLDLTDGEVTVGDQTYVGGVDTCHGEAVEVVVHRWANAHSDAEPEVVSEGLGDIRFEADHEAYTIAVVPEGTEVPQPDSVAILTQVSGPVDELEPDPGVEDLDPSAG